MDISDPYIERASLDRIDISKPHMEGNIRFLSRIANYAKNSFNDDVVIEFCIAVREFQKTKKFPSTTIANEDDFKEYIRLASRRRECSLTTKDLCDLWNKQGGLCKYSGIPLDNPGSRGKWDKAIKHPWRASLDRIDSSKPYTKDNVQFVSLIANYAKNAYPEETLIEFCQKVADYCNRLLMQS